MTREYVEQRDGLYYISATRISLDSTVYAFREGCSPETICEDFEGLTLEQVFGAIAYYLDHQAEVDSYLSERKQHWAELERQGVPPNSDLLARLDRARRTVSRPGK